MLSAVVIGVIIYTGMLVILCVGFSLTHLMEKFPNFAHASYAAVGTAFSFTFVRLWGYNPYLAMPLAFLLGGGVSVMLYLLIVRPMQKAGRGGITLAFAMFALAIVITALLGVYSYWVLLTYGFRTVGFMLRSFDFSWMGYPGIMFVSPLISLLLVISLHIFLTRVKFGVAIRASAENPELAVSLGVNIFAIHIASWFMTGAMSALAGAILPLWMPTSIARSDELLVSIIAGSVLGGLDSIYGAIVGGVAVVLAQKILPGLLIQALGIWIAGYEPLVPVVVIVTVLLIEPEGLTGIANREHATLQRIRRALKHGEQGARPDTRV